jgi:hypothetical protein
MTPAPSGDLRRETAYLRQRNEQLQDEVAESLGGGQ